MTNPRHRAFTRERGIQCDGRDVRERLVEVKEEIKALKSEKDGLEAKIKKEIGTNAAGMLPEGGRYSFKTGVRNGYIVAETTTRTLRRLKK